MYERSSSKNIYLNVAVNALKKLRSKSTSCPSPVTSTRLRPPCSIPHSTCSYSTRIRRFPQQEPAHNIKDGWNVPVTAFCESPAVFYYAWVQLYFCCKVFSCVWFSAENPGLVANKRAQSHEEVLGGRHAATTSFTVNRMGKQLEEKLTGTFSGVSQCFQFSFSKAVMDVFLQHIFLFPFFSHSFFFLQSLDEI